MSPRYESDLLDGLDLSLCLQYLQPCNEKISHCYLKMDEIIWWLCLTLARAPCKYLRFRESAWFEMNGAILFCSKSNRCSERWASAVASRWRRWGRKPPRCQVPELPSRANPGSRRHPARRGQSSSSRRRSRLWPESPGNHWLEHWSIHTYLLIRNLALLWLGLFWMREMVLVSCLDTHFSVSLA